jgi:hypothetical protein
LGAVADRVDPFEVFDEAFSMKKTAMKMGYVNAQLGSVNPACSARFEDVTDPSVDDQIQIYFAGSKSRWSIQIGAGYYAVNEIGFKDGEIEWLKDHGMFPTLKRAVLALCAILERQKNPGAA